MADNATDTTPAPEEPRKVSEIAAEILRTWTKPYFGAVPYIEAMRHLDTPQDNYGHDSGEGIVLRFLDNAKTWRGDDARRIKAELRTMLGKK